MLSTELTLLRPAVPLHPLLSNGNKRNRRTTIVGGAPGTVRSWRNKGARVPQAQRGRPWAWRLGGGDSAGGGAMAAGQPGRVLGGGIWWGLHPEPGVREACQHSTRWVPTSSNQNGREASTSSLLHRPWWFLFYTYTHTGTLPLWQRSARGLPNHFLPGHTTKLHFLAMWLSSSQWNRSASMYVASRPGLGKFLT